MVRPCIKTVNLTVTMPSGWDEFWKLIKKADTKGSWQLSDIADRTDAHERSVRDYIDRLERAGFIRRIQSDALLNKRPSYRLVRKPTDAPSIRRDGTVVTKLTIQQRLWNAMRSLKQFNAKELAFAAADEKGPAPIAMTEKYLLTLERAGYFVDLGGGYRLKPSMNTGPKAPAFFRAHGVFDVNSGVLLKMAPQVAELVP